MLNLELEPPCGCFGSCQNKVWLVVIGLHGPPWKELSAGEKLLRDNSKTCHEEVLRRVNRIWRHRHVLSVICSAQMPSTQPELVPGTMQVWTERSQNLVTRKQKRYIEYINLYPCGLGVYEPPQIHLHTYSNPHTQ